MKLTTPRTQRRLKLTMFAVLASQLNYPDSVLDEISPDLITPYLPLNEVLARVDRLRIEGRAIMKVHQTTRRKKEFFEFEYLLKDGDIPGGARTVASALCLRLSSLIGTPIPADERKEDDLERGPGHHRPAGRSHRPPPNPRNTPLTGPRPISKTRTGHYTTAKGRTPPAQPESTR